MYKNWLTNQSVTLDTQALSRAIEESTEECVL